MSIIHDIVSERRRNLKKNMKTVIDTETIKTKFFVGSYDYVEVLDFSVSILLVNILKGFHQANASDTER